MIRPGLPFLIAVIAGLTGLAETSRGQTDFPAGSLQLAGLDPSEAAVYSLKGIHPADGELALRLAWRARILAWSRLSAGAVEWPPSGGSAGGPAGSVPAVAETLGDWMKRHQFQTVSVRGRLTGLRSAPELDPDADPPFWRLELTTSGGTVLQGIAALVPAALRSARLPVDEIRLTGFAVAPVNGGGGDSTVAAGEADWMIAAQRLEWFPVEENAAMGITPGLWVLSRRGLDAGWIDTIRSGRFGALRVGERDAFDAFAGSVARTGSGDWENLLDRGVVVPLVSVFRNPVSAIGLPVTLRGSVRRVTEIGGGLTQLDLFVETGLREGLRITNEAGETLRFGSRLPVTVDCAASALPDDPGELLRGSVDIDGFVYRFWSYQSGFSDEGGASEGQTMPLVIGWRVLPVETGQGLIGQLLEWLALWVLGLVGLVFVAIFWMNRRDRLDRRREG